MKKILFADLDGTLFQNERAVMLIEFYRKDGQWRTSPVAQGFNGGLAALVQHFGGSVAEAIRMGRLLRESGFDTLVPADAVCQGSCVYLLAAGRDKTVRGHVGIHRPYFANGDSAQSGNALRYSPAAYLQEMRIPASLLTDMQAVDPHNVRVLTPRELAGYRLD